MSSVAASHEAIGGALHGALRLEGFDLLGATTTGARAEQGAFGLPTFGAADRLVLCIGNTRALWPKLKAAVRRSPELSASAHPVDDFTRLTVDRAAAEVARAFGLRHAVRYAAATCDAQVDIVSVAEAAGLGHRSPVRLLVHPEHGPWLGLRAAVVFDVEGPTTTATTPAPCETCALEPCVAAYEAAVAASGGAHRVTQASLERDFALWLAVRVACPVGHASRYDDEQAEYHYTKRRALLLQDEGPLEPRRGMD
jgi:methylmalonic aciduria homocystinuria type C protein